MSKKTVYITGLGTISAAGANLPDSMASLYGGQRNPLPPQFLQVDLEQAYPVFEALHTPPQSDEHTRTNQLAWQAAQEAIGMAAWSLETLQPLRVGVAMGTTVGNTLNNEPFYRAYKAGQTPATDAIQRYLNNNPAQWLARKLGVRGPQATIANACSSATDAIGLGKSWLEQDQCDVVLAGGSDELSRITCLGFISLLISSGNPCRPFDKSRDGLNLGEGAGMVLMESEKVYSKRKQPALATVAAYATCADAYHPTAPHPEGTGLQRAIEQALQQAELQPGQIGFVNAHGTSTPNNDQVEGSVLGRLFGSKLAVVSTKAYTGHTLGAAGGIEAVFTVQGLLDQRIPATAGFETYDENCHLQPTTENTDVETDFALSSSLAFGGNNSVLIFGRSR